MLGNLLGLPKPGASSSGGVAGRASPSTSANTRAPAARSAGASSSFGAGAGGFPVPQKTTPTPLMPTFRPRRKPRTEPKPSSEEPGLLWCDKWRPLLLSDMDLHPEFNQLLLDAAECNEMPHLLVYGPCGAGKMTRVYGLLRAIFGDTVDETEIKQHSIYAVTK